MDWKSFRLPEGAESIGDPVGENPFPQSSGMHRVWNDATRLAEEQVCRLDAAAASSLRPDNVPQVSSDLFVGRFDAWASRDLAVVSSDLKLRVYDKWLVALADSTLHQMSQF